MARFIFQRPSKLHWDKVRYPVVSAPAVPSTVNMKPDLLLTSIVSSLVYLVGHVALANLFGRLSMELFETDEDSMEWTDRLQASNKSPVKVRVQPLVM